MEELLTWFAKEFIQHVILHAPWIVVSALCAGGGVVLGVLMFGRRYKQRIAALEAELRAMRQQHPTTINNVVNVQHGPPKPRTLGNVIFEALLRVPEQPKQLPSDDDQGERGEP